MDFSGAIGKAVSAYDEVISLERGIREGEIGDRCFDDSSRLMYVETDNANYGIHSGIHVLPSDIGQDLIEDSDAIVLETGSMDYESVSENEIGNARMHGQYDRILERNEEENPSDIYFVDTPSRHGTISYLMTESFLKEVIPYNVAGGSLMSINPALAPLALPFMSSAYGSIFARATGKGEKSIGHLQTSQFYTGTGLRSAISAKKMEEFVAPRVSEEIDDKPNILVDYGAGHLDLAPYLEHPKLRDSVIKINSLWDHYPINKSYLDKVCQFSYPDLEDQRTLSNWALNLPTQDLTPEKEIHTVPELSEDTEADWNGISEGLSGKMERIKDEGKILD